jgi:uncharacterized phage protein (TIGR01671 family)
MREIKFRVWDKESKILYQKIWNLQWCINGIRFAWDDYENSDGETMITELIKNSYELMQYTGLLDKNGKEIYEGDILKFNTKGGNEMVYQVKWKGKGFKPTRMSEDNQEEIEIIGNIYENPELLSSN